MTAFGMASIALVLATLFVFATRIASRRLGESDLVVTRRTIGVAIGVALWMGAFAALAASGVLARFDARPPPLFLAMLTILLGVIVLTRSRVGRALGDGLPIAALVGFQAFRLPLELVMHEAARAGIMPVQMSFSGWNFDIVTGVTAIPVAWLAATGRAPRALLIAWNLLGSILLATIMTLAAVSTPVIAAFGPGAALNTFVAHVPYVWLPSVMVAAALVGHILLWRRLLGASPAAS